MRNNAWTEGDWYQQAPYYYDLIFDAGTAQESAFIAECIARFGRADSKQLLEPACGTGRLMAALGSAGFEVHGYDDSPEMLAIAQARLQKKNLAATTSVVRGRMESYAPPTKLAAAYNLVSTFKYLLSEADAAAHLQLVADALLPGGLYILGLHLSDYEDDRRSRERWHASEGKTHVVCNIQSWPADRKNRTEEVRSRLIARRGPQRKKLETNWTFRTYDAAQLRALLRKIPSLEHVASYDFCHDMARPRALHDEQLDVVLVLRRHPSGT